MAKKKTVKKGSEGEKHSGLGLAIVAAAATAAAGYFFYGSKDGAKNRQKIKGWMLKAKGEVLEKIEQLKIVKKEEYNKIIDIVAAKYSKMKNIDEDEVCAMMDDLRKHWKNIQKQIEPKTKKAFNKSKKAVKKTVNKIAKTIAKKTAEKK
ncbi:hypothetical protein KKH46_00780 [Patescibacteria group bacterium]|nr:hypothetical protein [Patescibacteria group bacterium]MBU1956628.1 hypothetical protein [Patescibacteria group bacterium]MBU2010239.1 hypothetical protein [Patescibacteria group bacterium]